MYVGSCGRGVLVDAGLSARELERRLRAAGLETKQVAAVVITHEHRDHIAGLDAWARRLRIPVHATRATWEATTRILGSESLRGVEWQPFEPGKAFQAGGLELTAIPTSHDAASPVGFRIAGANGAIGFATDLGFACPSVRERLQGARLLFLESNHEEELLAKGPYPWPLKKRIRSRLGHLSNADCGALVAELIHAGLEALVLGHLSEVNNSPRLAYDKAYRVLASKGAEADVTLLVARQDRPGRVVRVGRG